MIANLLRECFGGLCRANAYSEELYVCFSESWEHVAAKLHSELPAEDSSKMAKEDKHSSLVTRPQRGELQTQPKNRSPVNEVVP